MKTISILALAAPVAAFTSQNNAARQSSSLSESKVRYATLRCVCVFSRVSYNDENCLG